MLLIALSGCGGSKVLKEPEPLVVTQSLATASDQRLAATLDWVIVRDGPGTWAKNVDWDEYLIRVQNQSDEPIRVTNVTVLDSLGTRIEIGGSRRQLIDGTKETTRRYTDEGLKVEAGVGGGGALAVHGRPRPRRQAAPLRAQGHRGGLARRSRCRGHPGPRPRDGRKAPGR